MAMEIAKFHGSSLVIVDPAFVGSTPIPNELEITQLNAASNVTVDPTFTDTVPNFNELEITGLTAMSNIIVPNSFVNPPDLDLDPTTTQGSTVTFSNSNRTVFGDDVGYSNILGGPDTARNSGTYYFEYVYTYAGGITGSEDVGVGFAENVTPNYNYLGISGSPSLALYENGNLYTGNGTVGSATPAFSTGDVIAFEITPGPTSTTYDIYINDVLEYSGVTNFGGTIVPAVTVRGDEEMLTTQFASSELTYAPKSGIAFDGVPPSPELGVSELEAFLKLSIDQNPQEIGVSELSATIVTTNFLDDPKEVGVSSISAAVAVDGLPIQPKELEVADMFATVKTEIPLDPADLQVADMQAIIHANVDFVFLGIENPEGSALATPLIVTLF